MPSPRELCFTTVSIITRKSDLSDACRPSDDDQCAPTFKGLLDAPVGLHEPARSKFNYDEPDSPQAEGCHYIKVRLACVIATPFLLGKSDSQFVESDSNVG